MTGLLLGVALAASPGGFRLGTGLPESSVDLRNVLAVDAAGGWVGQSTLRGQVLLWRSSTFSVEAPMVYAGTTPASVGPGRVRAGYFGRVKKGEATVVSAGLEVSAHPGPQVPAWASIARESLNGFDALWVFEAAWDNDVPVLVRAGVGLGFLRDLQLPVWGLHPSLEGAICAVAPIAGPLELVGEYELLVDPTPMSARAAARFATGSSTIDLGVQVGVAADLRATVGPLLAARGRF